MSPRPAASPVPSLADLDETPTGDHTPAGPAPARATPEYVDAKFEGGFLWLKKWAVRGAAIGTVLTGGGIVGSHFSATDHADKAINERTAALEARHEETRRRLDTLEVKVDELRDNQDEAEAAAKQRQAELLEAIKKGRK